MIPLARPSLGPEEAVAVAEVLGTGMLVQGTRVMAFEERLAARTGRAHAVAVASGTGALELALEVLEIGEGDEVLLADLTWPSPGHAIRRRGAIPVLVDVHADEWNATAAAFAAARTDRTRAAIVIDQFGSPSRHAEIEEALGDLPVIEDAACALGSRLGERPAGAFGRLACLSFHPRKVVTTGEGGAVLTDDEALAARLRVLRNHGQSTPGRFEMAAGNHRLTEIAAAIGLCQLDRLDGMISRRRLIDARYREALEALPASPQSPAPGAEINVQTFGAVLDDGAPVTRDELVSRMKEAGVQAGILSYALHRLETVAPGDDASFIGSCRIVDRGFALPCHAELGDSDIEVVLRELRSILGGR